MSLPLGEDTRLWRSSGRQQRWVWPGRSGVCRPPPPPVVESEGGTASRAWLLPY